MSGNELSDATREEREEREGQAPARPAGPYWEDPVYHYISRQHRLAVANEDGAESERLDELMQALVGGEMPVVLYGQLDDEAKAEKKRQRRQRKGRRVSKPTIASRSERAPSVNIADLKKRIFNPQVSKENVVKALEALPPKEKKATISGLPPGLRRKLEGYLKDREH